MVQRFIQFVFIVAHKGGRDCWVRAKYVDGISQNLQSLTPY